MRMLIAAVAFAAILGAPAFAQSTAASTWKGASAAPARATTPASAKSARARSAYAAAFNGPRRGVLAGRTYARDCNVSPASPSYRTNCN
jgi:hypothetical protein